MMLNEVPAELLPVHWEACGLGCPVLLGGACGVASRSMAGCAGWSPKFRNAAAEIVYSWTLDSLQDDECGNASSWQWWAALFRDVRLILLVGSRGDVVLTSCPTDKDRDKAWKQYEGAWAGALHSGCVNGRECDGCTSCSDF